MGHDLQQSSVLFFEIKFEKHKHFVYSVNLLCIYNTGYFFAFYGTHDLGKKWDKIKTTPFFYDG
jgi:hypothetical protein